MNRANACALKITFQRDIEIRCVNTDKHIGFQRDKALCQIATNSQQAAQSSQHFHNAHHRQFFHFVPGFTAFGLHEWACDANKPGIRMTRF